MVDIISDIKARSGSYVTVIEVIDTMVGDAVII